MASRTRLATWGLVALLAVDVALVSAAFRNPFRQPATAPVTGAAATVTGTVPGSAGGTSTPAATSSTPAATGFSGSGSMVGVVPIDSARAWRFVQGACPGGGASLAHTDNGGRTWEDVPIPFGAISRVQVTDAAKVVVVGTEGAGCRETALRSTDTGQTWASGGALAWWYRSLATPTAVVNSNGRAGTPCGNGKALSVSALSATSAAVLCESGKVVETADGGGNWVEVSRGLSALAVDARVEASKLAALVAYVADGCSGVQVASIAAGATTKLGCVDLGGRSNDGLLTHVALSVEGNAGWLIVDGDTYTSDDGGKTWSTP